MKVKVLLGGIFGEKEENFQEVKEVHINFSPSLVGPRTGQMIAPRTVAIEEEETGHTYRFRDVVEIEIRK